MSAQDMLDYKAYAEDFRRDTRGMKAMEIGLYMTLTQKMYQEKKPVKEDYRFLSMISGDSKYAIRKAMEALIRRRKIIRTEEGLWNPQLDEELGGAQ